MPSQAETLTETAVDAAQKRVLSRTADYFRRRGDAEIMAAIYGCKIFTQDIDVAQDQNMDILQTASYLHGEGEVRVASRIYQHLLDGPSPMPDAYNLQGYALYQQGKPKEALEHAGIAIALRPGVPNYYNHMGLALTALGEGRWPDAAQVYLRALAIEPGHHNALDNLLPLLERMAAPGASVDQLQALLPDEAAQQQRWLRLGNLQARLQNHDAAAVAYEKSACLAPADIEPLMAMGALHQNFKQLERACAVYERVLVIEPGNRAARERLADSEAEMGEFQRAMARLEALYDEEPNAKLRARIDLAFPCIPDSAEHIGQIREKLDAQLDRYLAMPEAPPDILAPGFFYLAYQGRNDRLLQRKGALLARKTMPHLVHTAPFVAGYRGPGARIKLGIASSLFYNHSIGRTTRGIIEKLDRARFEVVLICLPPKRTDDMAQAMRSAAARVVDLTGDLHQDRNTIGGLQLDAIFYPDIGMNPYQAMLAHARLAPLQCTHFGHPETNGIPTVDWWISVDCLEPPNAQEHYSEQLHLLRDVPQFSYYYRPQLPEVLAMRAEFGFSDDEHLYICPQYLFKVHPGFDFIVEQILRRDKKARILFTRSPVEYWSTVILRRLEKRAGAELMKRVTCLQGMPMARLMNLERVCDAVLDTIHFNGYNTTLEAWAAGAPVVTMPGSLQRGLHTTGMYRYMGMEDLIAPDAEAYIQLVLRLGSDPDFNMAMREKIAARCDVLFENMKVVREYERFFEEKLAQLARDGFSERPIEDPAALVRAPLAENRRSARSVAA